MQLALLISEVPSRPFREMLRSLPENAVVLGWIADDCKSVGLEDDIPLPCLVDRWDQLLTEPVDAALFCGITPEMVAAARQFAHRGWKLLVPVEASSSPARLFEFTPIWQEHPDSLFPVFLSGMEQASGIAMHRFSERNYGPLWKLEFHRVLPEASESRPLRSADVIDRVLLQDLHWICHRTGFPHDVTMQTSGPEGAPVEITVLLGGTTTPEVRWSLKSHAGPEQWSLKLSGQTGELDVSSHDAPLDRPEFSPSSPHVSEMPKTAGQIPEADQTCSRRSADFLKEIQRILHDDQDRHPGTAWQELIQLAEIGAVARRSLIRRRTLEIHFGETSERSQFKTQMTAIGCGALLWTMFGMVVLLILGGLFDPRDREYRQAAAAGFVIPQEMFAADDSLLTVTGQQHFKDIAATWSSTSPVLIIEASPGVSDMLNEQREEAILQKLRASGIQKPGARTILRPLPGEWFQATMTFGWIVVFSPLMIVLLLQFLIFIARQHQPPAEKTSHCPWTPSSTSPNRNRSGNA